MQRKALFIAAVILGAVCAGWAGKDCTVSKQFELKHAQVLAGIMQDVYGAPLPGMKLELLSGRTIIRDLRADHQGRYDFGEVPPGKYRLHLQYGGDAFCAPRVKCGNQGCTFEPKLAFNPKNTLLID